MTDQTFSTIRSEEVVGRKHFKVIAASSVGTVFEWFDFFLYGSLAVVLSRNFFSGVNESTAFTLALLTFAAGLAVRPFGALVFGFLGDLWGRKNTFVVTLSLMGFATFGVGLLPTYDQIGTAAPWILVTLRMLQGLSVGGVYGGAAVYLAEHAPEGRRGFFTSWIQLTATLAMAMSLTVVFVTRVTLGEDDFSAWGWRIPFLLSIFLLAITLWIQLKLEESPVYLRMKSAGKTSAHPWKDAFGNWKNLRLILIALFGAITAMAVIWYAAQFYVLFFLERVLKVDGATANLLVTAALILHTPLYVLFGWLSDKVGRKPIIMAACALCALTYFPIFKGLTEAANPDLARAVKTSPVIVMADQSECSLQFDPVGTKIYTTSCDITRTFLTRAGISYKSAPAPASATSELRVGDQSLPAFDGRGLSAGELRERRAAWEKSAADLLASAGYPAKADPEEINHLLVIFWLFVPMIYSAMVYGPLAAMLTEFFPAKIRYTSMSFPYHIGVGWLGGFLPSVAFAIIAATGNIYAGLWYPIFFSALTLLVGLIFLPETKDADIRH